MSTSQQTKPNSAAQTTAIARKDLIESVAARVMQFVENGELHLPPAYSAPNALKSAWLLLQSTVDKEGRPALQVCTKESVANALLSMVIQGLNPDKRQCYFIAYGDRLLCQRSYFGSMHVAKQVAGAADIWAEVVYKGDEFEYEIKKGRKFVTKHVQRLGNVQKSAIVAAYCTIEFEDPDRPPYTEIMTMDQIKQAWAKSQMRPFDDKGELKPGSTHAQFTEEMAKKTVINRACKALINSSSDASLLIKYHFNQTDEERAEEEAAEDAAANANQGPVIDVEPVVHEQQATPEPEPRKPTEAQKSAEPPKAETKSTVQGTKAGGKPPAQGTLTEGPGY